MQYDRQGNILGLNRNDETGTAIDQLGYTYNRTNRLQAVTDAHGETSLDWDAEPTTFAYDPNGHLVKQTENGSDSTLFAYDHRPEKFGALKATLPDGKSLRFRYTADGQRYFKRTPANTYTYIVDGSQTLAVMTDDTLRHWNIMGNEVEGRLQADAGSLRYYITDHLGSTRAVVDNNGNVLETFDYYPYGLLMPGRSSTTGNTIEKFTGKERDEAIGLDYFGARYLDPALGRWTTYDPLADDAAQVDKSPYAYAWNNPTNVTDPDGQCPWCIGAVIGAATDYALQVGVNLAEGKNLGSALTDVDGTSILVSAGAGALSGGLSVLSKANKASKLVNAVSSKGGEVAFDAASSVAGQLATDGEVSVTDVAIDITIGGVAGKKAGDLAENSFRNSKSGKILLRDLDRAERIANKSTRPGRQTQAQNARAELNKEVAKRSTAASVAASNTGSETAKTVKKVIEDEKNN